MVGRVAGQPIRDGATKETSITMANSRTRRLLLSGAAAIGVAAGAAGIAGAATGGQDAPRQDPGQAEGDHA
jgi:hypothetical protein